MKTRYILLAIVALAISACVGNTLPSEPEEMPMTITAFQEGSEMTRTTVLGGGAQVYWEPSEQIQVFFKDASAIYTSSNTENALVTDFTGNLTGLEEADANNLIWGLYPCNENASCDGEFVTTYLSPNQDGRTGSFAKNTHITLAQSKDQNLYFYSVCGGLRFSLTQEGIKRVTFEGNNGEAIAGKIKIAFANGFPVVQEISEGKTKITLTAPGGGTFQTGQWYYISAIPGSLPNGYTMIFYKESESAKLTSFSPVFFKRGIFGSLAIAEEDLIFNPSGPDIDIAVDLGLSVKWAPWNVGTSVPEEYGAYFSWGETDEKGDYDQTTHKWKKPDTSELTKYNTLTNYGNVDNKTTLDLEDDAARVNWGSTWRMPTQSEFNELINNCDVFWTTENDVYGCRFTSKKAGYTNKSIFLPAAGYRYNTWRDAAGSAGLYLSSSLNSYDPYYAYCLCFTPLELVVTNQGYRCYGYSVRAVCDK